MRLLLDESVPRPLLRDLHTHDAHHVVDQGWSAKRNGELLQLMVAAGFKGFLTVDRSLPFQQNLRASGIGLCSLSLRRIASSIKPSICNSIAYIRRSVSSRVARPKRFVISVAMPQARGVGIQLVVHVASVPPRALVAPERSRRPGEDRAGAARPRQRADNAQHLHARRGRVASTGDRAVGTEVVPNCSQVARSSE